MTRWMKENNLPAQAQDIETLVDIKHFIGVSCHDANNILPPVKARFDIEIYFNGILQRASSSSSSNADVKVEKRFSSMENLFPNRFSSPFDVSFIINVIFVKSVYRAPFFSTLDCFIKANSSKRIKSYLFLVFAVCRRSRETCKKSCRIMFNVAVNRSLKPLWSLVKYFIYY